jgi:hypothetical protein
MFGGRLLKYIAAQDNSRKGEKGSILYAHHKIKDYKQDGLACGGYYT